MISGLVLCRPTSNILTIPAAYVSRPRAAKLPILCDRQYHPVATGMTQGLLNTDAGVQGSASILFSCGLKLHHQNNLLNGKHQHTCSDRLALTPAKNSFDNGHYCTVLVAVVRLTVCLSQPLTRTHHETQMFNSNFSRQKNKYRARVTKA